MKVLLETSATITDEILDLNDWLLGSLFPKAKRQFENTFQKAGRPYFSALKSGSNSDCSLRVRSFRKRKNPSGLTTTG